MEAKTKKVVVFGEKKSCSLALDPATNVVVRTTQNYHSFFLRLPLPWHCFAESVRYNSLLAERLSPHGPPVSYSDAFFFMNQLFI